MFAKSPNLEPENKERSNNSRNLTTYDPVAESLPQLAPDELAQNEHDLKPDRAKLVIFPSQAPRTQTTWPDYEELFPTAQNEVTERLVELTSAVINRRCYYHQYWPENTVFRIKDIDTEHHTVYLNLIYRWVSATKVSLIKNLTPQRPPCSIELDYTIDIDDCSDF